MKLSNFLFASAILATATALAACADVDDSDGEDVGAAMQGMGGTGTNNIKPKAIDIQPLRRSITDAANITAPNNANPRPICAAGTVTDSGCTMEAHWESWLLADADRGDMMKGIAKCAVEGGYTIKTSDEALSFPGQWGLYPGWKSNPLDSQEKRERISACILTLLNGNNQTLNICIIGPGGAPFSDACTDPLIINREAGFFGDLFSANPTAYVVGPATETMIDNGRACTSSSEEGSYCCAENDNTCAHHIIKAGAMQGSNARCNSFTTVSNGTTSFTYCNSFFSTREPGRTYAAGFTTFVPAAQ
jgi:hypothetical protein